MDQVTFEDIGNNTYSGYFINGNLCGFGIYSHSSGFNYKGDWRNDLQEGIGIEYWEDSVYIGEFKEGKKEGIGQYME